MSGKCVYCGIETKTKMDFVNANGIRFNYYSCMKGECAVKSIDGAFDKLHKKIDQEDFTGLSFEPDDGLVALFG